MKALCWEGVNKVAVRDVPDPGIRNRGDVILRVRQSVTCGSDLHLLGGYIPFMRQGDVLGHEFIGDVVEVGEVLRVDPVPHGKRKPTPQGAALEKAADLAPKEGVL